MSVFSDEFDIQVAFEAKTIPFIETDKSEALSRTKITLDKYNQLKTSAEEAPIELNNLEGFQSTSEREVFVLKIGFKIKDAEELKLELEVKLGIPPEQNKEPAKTGDLTKKELNDNYDKLASKCKNIKPSSETKEYINKLTDFLFYANAEMVHLDASYKVELFVSHSTQNFTKLNKIELARGRLLKALTATNTLLSKPLNEITAEEIKTYQAVAKKMPGKKASPVLAGLMIALGAAVALAGAAIAALGVSVIAGAAITSVGITGARIGHGFFSRSDGLQGKMDELEKAVAPAA
ncbi:MAG: hypothetical protein QNK11_02665 [Legionella sp.]|nr:hypothetical protein [Legionella sp.]